VHSYNAINGCRTCCFFVASGEPLLPHAVHNDLSVLILRLWREERELKDLPAVWRGEVEVVGSQEHYYVKNIDEIVLLINQRLSEMGIDEPNR
jgi:hypothetical protein